MFSLSLNHPVYVQIMRFSCILLWCFHV